VSGQLAVGIAGAAIGFVVSGFNPIGAQIGYLAATTAFTLLNPPKVEGPRLSDLRIQRSEYGAGIPWIRGIVRSAGQVIWQTDLQEHEGSSGGKGGGSETTTYTYSASFAILLCEGPIRGIRRIWADGRVIWQAGEEANSEVPYTLYLGDDTQDPDPTIEADVGVDRVPDYRGYAYIVFTEMPLADYSNRIPNLEFEIDANGASNSIDRVGEEWSPNGDNTTLGTASIPLDGAYRNGSQLVCCVYTGDSPQSSYQEFRYDLMTGELEGTGTSIDVDNPLDSSSVLWRTAQNSNVAFATATGAGTDDTSRWYVAGVRGTEVVEPPVGTDDYNAVVSRPVVLDDFVYACGGSGANCFVGKWGFVDASEVSGTPEAEYFDIAAEAAHAFSAPSCGLAVSDDGYVYAGSPYSGGVELWKLDPADMSIVRYWDITDADIVAAMAPITNAAFTVYRDMLGVPAGLGASLYSINDDDTFTLIDEEASTGTVTGSPMISLGGGYVLTHDGIFRIDSLDSVGDCCAAISEYGLRGLSSSQYDVSDLPEKLRGFKIGTPTTKINAINALRPAYFFGLAEVDGVALFRHTHHEADGEIPEEDLAAFIDGQEPPAAIKWTGTPDAEVPNRLIVKFLDAASDFNPNTAIATRASGASVVETTLDLPLVLTYAEAKQIAEAHLMREEVERWKGVLTVPRKWLKVAPLDVWTIGDYTVRVADVAWTLGEPVQVSVLQARQAIFDGLDVGAEGPGGGPGGGVDGGGTTTRRPLVATESVLLDILGAKIPPYGFGWAAAPAASGRWPGAALYKSLDGGTTYTSVATISTPSTIGHATTALDDYVGGAPSGGSGSPIGGGALALPETRVIPGGVSETVYTMQVEEDCDVTVALGSGSGPVWVAHGQDSTDWIAYGSGVAYPPLYVLAGEYFSWKFSAITTQEMRPQSQPHGALGVGAGGGSSGAPGFDDTGTVTVQLHDTTKTLESINDAGLANGMNKAALRSGDLWEIFQYQTATLLGPGLYELTDLLRGVDDTTDFMVDHAIGDEFVLLSTMVGVQAPASELNREYLYKAVTAGLTLAETTAVEFTNTGDVDEPIGGGVIPPGGGTPGNIVVKDEGVIVLTATKLDFVGAGVAVTDGGSDTATITIAAASASMVPTYIGPTETFTVPADRQALYAMTIDNEGILDLEGVLIGVD
jgi:hypothetical protein